MAVNSIIRNLNEARMNESENDEQVEVTINMGSLEVGKEYKLKKKFETKLTAEDCIMNFVKPDELNKIYAIMKWADGDQKNFITIPEGTTWVLDENGYFEIYDDEDYVMFVHGLGDDGEITEDLIKEYL